MEFHWTKCVGCFNWEFPPNWGGRHLFSSIKMKKDPWMCTLMWASPLACLYLMAIILFNFLPIVVLKFEMLFCIQVVRFLGHFEKSTQVYFMKFIFVKTIVTIIQPLKWWWALNLMPAPVNRHPRWSLLLLITIRYLCQSSIFHNPDDREI